MKDRFDIVIKTKWIKKINAWLLGLNNLQKTLLLVNIVYFFGTTLQGYEAKIFIVLPLLFAMYLFKSKK